MARSRRPSRLASRLAAWLGPDGRSHASERSVLSAFSHRSVLSFASAWSSASAGSAASIGSVGSFLSIGSVGSVLSIGSVGSALSIGSIGAAGGIGANPSDGPSPTAVAVLAWSALAVVAVDAARGR